ncbi:MAG: TIM barrel protein [Bacilli bacterium]|nr:TIM barrel protein [Bacilli bacterium]
MLKTGLVSVTFRKLTPLEIVTLVNKAGLKAIEWGGDIHVPHGNTKKAEEVYKLTMEAGLEVASYGSYYKPLSEGTPEFEAVLDTACALQTKTIRIWAGGKRSRDVDERYWDSIIEDTVINAKKAEKVGISLAFEYHDHTLTDTIESALRLINAINLPNVFLYWQPAVNVSVTKRCEDLQQVYPYLSNLHVFEWEGWTRLPLEQGIDNWRTYLSKIPNSEKVHYAMLEFVQNDSPEQFLQDAEILKLLVNEYQAK